MGSSRDARMAGTIPKKTPTAGGEADPDGERPPRQRDGKSGEPVDAPSDAPADDDAEHAAGRRQEDGLEQELPEDLDAPRAERLAHADLARALGDADRHDAHHADAADHERDRRQHDEREERRLADLIQDLAGSRPA